MPLFSKRSLHALRWILALGLVIFLSFLLWGNRLLIASEPPPGHVDAAVVLQGSIVGQKIRTAGAMDLLRGGIADRALLSLPKESYWGQSIPPVARAYLERNFGGDLAVRVDFCETGEEVNSTAQEMQALTPCIEQHHWRSIVVITSNYHTRRAGLIWRKISAQDANVHVYIQGIEDPEFQLPWWRHRQSAKIFLWEFTKLVWTALGG